MNFHADHFAGLSAQLLPAFNRFCLRSHQQNVEGDAAAFCRGKISREPLRADCAVHGIGSGVKGGAAPLYFGGRLEPRRNAAGGKKAERAENPLCKLPAIFRQQRQRRYAHTLYCRGFNAVACGQLIICCK